jgi:hypothetical protein
MKVSPPGSRMIRREAREGLTDIETDSGVVGEGWGKRG